VTGPRPRTAVLGLGEVPWDSPVAPADDAGLRGDGCFETLLVHGGAPARIVRLDEHLDRFERSAAELATGFDRPGWESLARSIVAEVATADEAVLRLSLSRSGLGLATLRALPPAVLAGRAGVDVVTLPRGTVTVAGAPWLLGTVKTSSYALNSAALREAARRGVDDALFVDADGFLLEGPTANLVWFAAGRWWTPSVGGRGVLPGTTLAALATPCVETLMRPADLTRVDGAWLLSSLRGAAAVRSVDGVALRRDPDLTRHLQDIALDRPGPR
jgi:4-amino-4-deoxychorismate lyase